MITKKNTITNSDSYVHHPMCHNNYTYPLEDVVFFDIETTGLQADSSMLYLIGAMTYEEEKWTITQWLSDSYEDEKNILEVFYQHIKDKTLLIHFNGSTFDIPYLNKKYKHFGIENPIINKDTIDIYREITPLRKILPTDNLKLSTLSSAIGLTRNDIYSGKELIGVYKQFIANERIYKLKVNSIKESEKELNNPEFLHVKNEHQRLEEILLLHNYEDISSLLPLYNLINLKELLVSPTNILDYDNTKVMYDKGASSNLYENCIRIVIPIKTLLPLTLCRALELSQYIAESSYLSSFDLPPITCKIESSFLTLELPIYYVTLKYFFKNYKDYYYLPVEDTAMHVSVAQYVDKNYRKKATPSTCYIKKESHFIPLLLADYKKSTHKEKDNYPANAFYSHYEDKLFFVEKEDFINLTLSDLSQYCNNILWNCFK